MNEKRTTIQDIAREAGVTKATVSMVVNNDSRITEATRLKVMEVVRKLHYVPNDSARKLARGKTDILAVLSPRFTSPFVSAFLEVVEQRAFHTGRYDHGIQPFTTRNVSADLDELMKRILYGHQADAVILITQAPLPENVREYRRMGLPLILVENNQADTHSVCYDNVQGARQAVTHLLKRGRKRIGLIVGSQIAKEGKDLNPSALERMKGYVEALKAHGVAFEPARVVEVRKYEYEEGRECLRRILDRGVKMDALFCAAGDIVAMGVLEEARISGLSIPKDLAVVGYDDVQAARILNPALTTVRQSFLELGIRAFDIAMDAIDGRLKEPCQIVLQQELVVRESS